LNIIRPHLLWYFTAHIIMSPFVIIQIAIEKIFHISTFNLPRTPLSRKLFNDIDVSKDLSLKTTKY